MDPAEVAAAVLKDAASPLAMCFKDPPCIPQRGAKGEIVGCTKQYVLPPYAPPIALQSVYQASLKDFAIRDLLELAQKTCPANSFPTWSGMTDSVHFTETDYPFRVPLDYKVVSKQAIIDGKANLESAVSQNCNALNGTFPGCVATGATGCAWAPVLGSGESSIEGLNLCSYEGSFCLKTDFDHAFKTACCLQSLHTDGGLSESIWLQENFRLQPNTSISGGLGPDDPPFMTPTSKSFNPYQLFCSPLWCQNSPDCDATLYETCAWSVTEIDGSPVHACLAESGGCRSWYSASTFGAASLVVGQHSWRLIDAMIEDYCFKSASTLGDTTSCACIETAAGPDAVFYTSCTALGIDPLECGPDQVLPLVGATVEVGDPFPQIVGNALCRNVFCTSAANDGSAFVDSNRRLQLQACPENLCIIAVASQEIVVGNLSTSNFYVGNLTSTCSQKSISNQCPPFQAVELPTVWWYDRSAANPLLNPEATQIITIQNQSFLGGPTLNYSISWANVNENGEGLPSWLQRQGSLVGQLDPGESGSLAITIVPQNLNPTTAPTVIRLPVTVSALDGSGNTINGCQLSPVTLSMVLVDLDTPIAPTPSNPDNVPDGLPVKQEEGLSAGGKSLLLFTLILLLAAAWFAFSASLTRRTSQKALRYFQLNRIGE